MGLETEQLVWVAGVLFAVAGGGMAMAAHAKRQNRQLSARLYYASYGLMSVSILLVALRAVAR